MRSAVRKSSDADLLLEALAHRFHQDFKVMGVDPDQWGKTFMKALSTGERHALRVELLKFLAAYPGASTKGIRHAWVRLGAEGWPRSANLRQTIESWIKTLE
jgi:hypothetical protein